MYSVTRGFVGKDCAKYNHISEHFHSAWTLCMMCYQCSVPGCIRKINMTLHGIICHDALAVKLSRLLNLLKEEQHLLCSSSAMFTTLSDSKNIKPQAMCRKTSSTGAFLLAAVVVWSVSCKHTQRLSKLLRLSITVSCSRRCSTACTVLEPSAVKSVLTAQQAYP